MEWKRATQKENATVIPKSWIHIHYYEALNTLFRIENSLRVFVYIVLKNQFFEGWSDINITSDDSEPGTIPGTIKSIAKRRIHQAQDFGYLGYGINCPVMHLTSGELIRIITHEAYWPYFRPYFPASKQVVQNKLDEIGVIRNSLAHFRPIKSDDVELIKQNARHALIGVEQCLNQLGSCNDTVPTNTQDQWYRELSTLGTELCALRLAQCADEKWINLTLEYKSPIVLIQDYSSTYFEYNILNLRSPSILTKHSNLAKLATYLSESEIRPRPDPPKPPDFTKSVALVFSRRVIQDNYSMIKADIQSFLCSINEETELIRNDNLARGQFISVALVRASKQNDGSWRFFTENTLSPVTQEDPAEYWGNTFLGFSMLTFAQKYPWMPVGVSEFDLPWL